MIPPLNVMDLPHTTYDTANYRYVSDDEPQMCNQNGATWPIVLAQPEPIAPIGPTPPPTQPGPPRAMACPVFVKFARQTTRPLYPSVRKHRRDAERCGRHATGNGGQTPAGKWRHAWTHNTPTSRPGTTAPTRPPRRTCSRTSP
ncbi:hypothetical protein HMPREF1503_0790 [Olsenella uli MSTE5]|nr:hypothetical protein HMPREF1503_0790 [Olsenella uli MSTE5]